MLELGTFSANLHDVSVYHYNDEHFSLVFDVNVGSLWPAMAS